MSLPNSWSTACEVTLAITAARVTPVVVVKVGEVIVVAENGGNGARDLFELDMTNYVWAEKE